MVKYDVFLDTGISIELPPGVDPSTKEGYALLYKAACEEFARRLTVPGGDWYPEFDWSELSDEEEWEDNHLTCRECGKRCFVDPESETSHHGEDADTIDYDADARHVAIPEYER